MQLLQLLLLLLLLPFLPVVVFCCTEPLGPLCCSKYFERDNQRFSKLKFLEIGLGCNMHYGPVSDSFNALTCHMSMFGATGQHRAGTWVHAEVM
jgi:hypothetical protein